MTTNDDTTTARRAIPYPPLFPLGRIVATPGALEACPHHHLLRCLFRHSRGDWGVTCAEDKAQNDLCLAQGCRLLSAYPIDPAKALQGLRR